MDIHAHIRALRQQANLSQGELATAIGVSRGTIGAWEAGTATPRLGSVVRLATVFGCRPSELVGYEPVHLGSICVPAQETLARGHSRSEPRGDLQQANLPPQSSLVRQTEVPGFVIAAHARLYAFDVDASQIHPLAPGRITLVYDPYRMPTATDVAVVRTSPTRIELRRCRQPNAGISLLEASITGTSYAQADPAFPRTLGTLCWYQPARALG